MAEPFLNQIDALRQKFNLEKQEFRGEITWIVTSNQLVELCLQLRDQFTFAMLENQTAVDYWPEQDPRFHLVTQLYSFEQNFTLTLRILHSRATHRLRPRWKASTRTRTGMNVRSGIC